MMAFSKIITGGNQHKQAMLNPSKNGLGLPAEDGGDARGPAEGR